MCFAKVDNYTLGGTVPSATNVQERRRMSGFETSVYTENVPQQTESEDASMIAGLLSACEG